MKACLYLTKIIIGLLCGMAGMIPGRAASIPPASSPQDVQAVALVTAAHASTSYHDRLEGLGKISHGLGRTEREALYGFLALPKPPPAMNDSQMYALKNDILTLIVEQSVPDPRLDQVLPALYQDTAQPREIRDYSLQHLRLWYPQSDRKQLLLDLLKAVAADAPSPLSGTALLSLWGISEQDSKVEAEGIRQTAFRLAENEKAAPESRVSAIQVCGKMSLRTSEPLAFRLARNSAVIPLQMAALATLGDIGATSESARLLQDLSKSPDSRIQQVARSAWRHWQRRMP